MNGSELSLAFSSTFRAYNFPLLRNIMDVFRCEEELAAAAFRQHMARKAVEGGPIPSPHAWVANCLAFQVKINILDLVDLKFFEHNFNPVVCDVVRQLKNDIAFLKMVYSS